MAAELLTERPRSHTMVLTISDPAMRNALSPQVYAAGIESLASAEADPAIRAVILRGAGEHFCAGGDLQRIKGTRALGPDEGVARQHQSVERLGEFIETLMAFPKPIVAAVEGYAAGAGFALALACDLMVASDDAKFILAYGKVGLSPDGGASWQLARRLPANVALQMLLLPEPVSARQAHTWGLVNTVAPKGEALAAALALTDRLSAMAPNVMTSAKELVQGALTHSLHDHLEAEREHFVANLFHDNGAEGIEAFLAKRSPMFKA